MPFDRGCRSLFDLKFQMTGRERRIFTVVVIVKTYSPIPFPSVFNHIVDKITETRYVRTYKVTWSKRIVVMIRRESRFISVFLKVRFSVFKSRSSNLDHKSMTPLSSNLDLY